MSFRQRAYAEKDWPAFADFVRRRFGQCHAPDLTFNEFWFRTPWHRQWAIRLLGDAAGGLAGAMCAIVVRAKFGAKRTTLAWISSGAVSDDARAAGAGSQLYFWVYKSFPLVGALSGNENSLPINSVLGRDIPGVAMRRFLSVHRVEAAELCQPGRGAAVISAVRRCGGKSASEVVGVPADYDALWATVRERFYCVVEKDAEHLEWRYRLAPHIDYRFWEIRDAGGLHALAVVRLQETPEGRVCRVVDFVSRTPDASAAWRAVLARAEDEGALATDFMVIGSDQDAALAEAGLLPADASTGLDVFPHLLSPVEHRAWSNTFHLGGGLALDDQSWRHPEAIYFTKGDSDRDWPTLHDLERRKSLGKA